MIILYCCPQGQGHNEGSNPLGIFVWTISSEPLNRSYILKLGMLMRHHNLECYAKSLGSYLQGQGHSVGSNPEKN